MKKIIVASTIAFAFAAPHAFASDSNMATKPAAELQRDLSTSGDAISPSANIDGVATNATKPAIQLKREMATDGTLISPSTNDDAVAENAVKPAQEINKENATN